MIKKTLILGAVAAMCTVNAWAGELDKINVQAIYDVLKKSEYEDLNKICFVRKARDEQAEGLTLKSVFAACKSCKEYVSFWDGPEMSCEAFLKDVVGRHNQLWEQNVKDSLVFVPENVLWTSGNYTFAKLNGMDYMNFVGVFDENKNILCAMPLYNKSNVACMQYVDSDIQFRLDNWNRNTNSGDFSIVTRDDPKWTLVTVEAPLQDAWLYVGTTEVTARAKDHRDLYQFKNYQLRNAGFGNLVSGDMVTAF